MQGPTHALTVSTPEILQMAVAEFLGSGGYDRHIRKLRSHLHAQVDRTRAETTRVVHPLGLVEKGSTWYLVGDTDNGLRTFRVNRVRAVELTDAKAVRPPDFDLAAAWQDIVDTVERQRVRVQAVVRVDRRGYFGLREQFGPTTRIVADPAGDGNDDRIDVEVGAGSPWIIAQHLAGWADYVEVVSPPEVRDRLAEIGRLLVTQYP